MRKIYQSSTSALVGLAGVLAMTRAASAAMYGNFTGPDLTYQNVTESNDSQLTTPPATVTDPGELFGPPVLSPPNSDNLSFMDMNFSALASDGDTMLQDGELTFNVAPNPGKTLTSLAFDEGGSWSVEGTAGDASAEATLLFSDVRITAVNGTPLSTPIIVDPTFSESEITQTGSATYTPTTGDVLFTSTGGTGIGTWDITANFDLEAALSGADMNGAITSVSVALDDRLQAETTPSDGGLTLATIDKKHFIVSGGTMTFGGGVPEPASFSLVVCGGLVLARRRRTSR